MKVVYNPFQKKEKKVPVKDLPSGTIFYLPQTKGVYQKVGEYTHNSGHSVDAIILGAPGYISNRYGSSLLESNDYIIIRDSSQLAFVDE